MPGKPQTGSTSWDSGLNAWIATSISETDGKILAGAEKASAMTGTEGDRVVADKGYVDSKNPSKKNLGPGTTLALASNAITVTDSYHRIDTEGAAATDQLDTINGGSDGDLLILQATAAGRVITARHQTGNLFLQGGNNLAMDNLNIMTLIHDGGNWFEASRSINS